MQTCVCGKRKRSCRVTLKTDTETFYSVYLKEKVRKFTKGWRRSKELFKYLKDDTNCLHICTLYELCSTGRVGEKLKQTVYIQYLLSFKVNTDSQNSWTWRRSDRPHWCCRRAETPSRWGGQTDMMTHMIRARLDISINPRQPSQFFGRLWFITACWVFNMSPNRF